MTTESATAPTLSLMGDLSTIPQEYLSQIANIKRVLERWTMDPSFREAFVENPESALGSTGLPVRPEEIVPLVDNEEAKKLSEAIAAGKGEDYPISVLRYRAFCREKRLHRTQVREECRPSHPSLAAWRARQINRCVGELGIQKAEAIVHAPAAFELSKGCTVGCWFCGVSAPKFEHWYPYTEENGALWRGALQVLKDIMGPCVKQGFLYWATDGLDNPDYEKFVVDFHQVTGRCPQTTTAQANKDIDRTRGLLQLAQSLDSEINRFSVISLDMMRKIHAGFEAEELIRVECIPQNREAQEKYQKAKAGRARKFAEKRTKEVRSDEDSSTIACVSGFLFNMVERSVKLITPCNSSERWPLGYWVLAEGTFNSPEELRSWLEKTIEQHIRPALELSDVVRLRPDLTWEVDGDKFYVISRWIKITLSNHQEPARLLEMLDKGTYTAEEIALKRERESHVSLEETFLLLNDMFKKGLFDEEPCQVVERELVGATA